ncbi:OmpA family protein (plasmid) [Azospirillum oryzae]|uniref:OmpA family protein n=1 Tax=Azospirillum oryzae TaxID=286727 RepID=A0A6N1ANS2_9PROT|nr:flagellar motor protein MotB [Azospirillum oryzae]KAA0586464.1 OmpA family protein [Azospirillum oryzae]QKS53475.1 OmpA family protein [Azospirillum oryzae]GLR83111.1 membrane protein [Azospirillum oryzae]
MPRKTALPPIIVKRHLGSHDEEEHNGTWKLAYADFVTAMMTFFLVMWLMNITTTEQRKGIADYFNPVAVSQSNSGADGMLAGRSVDKTGSLTTPNAAGDQASPVASPPVVASVGDSDRQPAGRKDPMPHPPGGTVPPVDLLRSATESAPLTPAAEQPAPGVSATRAELEALLDRQSSELTERVALETLERDLRQRIAAAPDLNALQGSLVIQQVPEGLRVQLTDQARFSMFKVGSAQMNEPGRRLMRMVASALASVPNPIGITGHTDALGYAPDAKYGNWELSSDRANAARRELIASGIPGGRIVRVEGRADLDHFGAGGPLDPSNRRISITLLRR